MAIEKQPLLLDELVKLLVTANGPHQVRTQIYSLPLASLHQLYKLATDLGFIMLLLTESAVHTRKYLL